MSAPNFSYQRRCVLVTNGDFEFSNKPDATIRFDDDRSYPSFYINEYADDFATIAIVLTCGYYADACIDIVDKDDKADELLGYTNYYSNHNREELLGDICYFLGCSRNFANTRLKGCRLGSDDYEYNLEKAFERIVEDWREVELKRANKVVNKIKRAYHYKELRQTALFSNGEAWYESM